MPEREIKLKIEWLKKSLSDSSEKNRCKGKKVLIVLGGGKERIYACAGNYFTEVFERIGFENVLKNFSVKYPQLSYESFYSLNPDYIVVLSSGEKGDFNPCKDKRLEMLKACRNKNAFVLKGKRILHAGSGLEDLLKEIEKKMNKCFK